MEVKGCFCKVEVPHPAPLFFYYCFYPIYATIQKNRKMTKLKLPILFLLTFLIACSDFKQKAKPLFKNLTALYELSLYKCKITEQVWSAAIYENKYALSTPQNSWRSDVSDFNLALARMEKEPKIKEANKTIEDFGKLVETEIEGISDKKDASYDKLVSLYSNVRELSRIALKPTGSLKSFGIDINDKETQINMLITELKTRNPEFEK